MKIDISKTDTEQFMVHQHIINGKVCHLVQPQHIGAKWQKNTLIFRSSLWNSDGELISASFPKFFNWSEQPELSPVPKSLDKTTIVEKIDGSTLIVSKWNGQYILRTRGTVDATKLDNGHELELFKQTVLTPMVEVMKHPGDTWEFSLLFEWVSPNQRIILNYGDTPQWFLVGIAWHSDYSLSTQNVLDAFAKAHFLKRPPSYTFPSIEDLMAGVEQWKGKEGVCVYSNNGQTIHKVKALSYLIKHRFKSEATLENTLELYFSMGKPDYQDFETKLAEAFDYECFEMVRGYVSVICDAAKTVKKIQDGFDVFISDNLRSLPTRREQAAKVISAYSTTNRAAMIFTLLDGKSLSSDQEKKLFWQILKK